jgi:chitinase
VQDVIPPATSIASPSDSSTVSGIIDVLINASDNVGVNKVDLYTDGVLTGIRTSTPYRFSWDTTQGADGVHTLQSRACDAAGNIGDSALISVTVNNFPDVTPPVVSITSPQNGDAIRRKSSVIISAVASDNAGIAKVEFYVNGILLCTDTVESYTCDWKVPAAKTKASYALQAVAYDRKGNIGYSEIITVKAI